MFHQVQFDASAEVRVPSRNFSNREFIDAIRAELIRSGRPDVAVSRLWIDEGIPGEPFLLNVPVGTELVVPLKVMSGFFEPHSQPNLEWHATEFAKALINLKLAETMLIRYARKVRLAAIDVVFAARKEGLDVRLVDVGFKPTYAYHITGKSWSDAAFRVLASVAIAHTSFFHRPTLSVIWVEEPEDVETELADLLENQRTYQGELAELSARGADLTVDQLTLDLLETHGLDAADILTQVWKCQCVNLKVEHRGSERSLSLSSSHGRVTASFHMEGAHWNGEHLWFAGEEEAKDHKPFIGKTLGDLVPHPAFSSRPVVDVFVRHIDHVVFDLGATFLFDADTGRIWRETATGRTA